MSTTSTLFPPPPPSQLIHPYLLHLLHSHPNPTSTPSSISSTLSPPPSPWPPPACSSFHFCLHLHLLLDSTSSTSTPASCCSCTSFLQPSPSSAMVGTLHGTVTLVLLVLPPPLGTSRQAQGHHTGEGSSPTPRLSPTTLGIAHATAPWPPLMGHEALPTHWMHPLGQMLPPGTALGSFHVSLIETTDGGATAPAYKSWLEESRIA